MCGISGVITKKICREDCVARVSSMISAQRHRGPDDEGIWSITSGDAVISFGHNRLSIIDITNEGHQPMTERKDGNVIVFNGEVYNYKEIKTKLLGRGYQFKSQTDTEVILNAYTEWGGECFKEFRGIFAISIWDNKNKKLVIARDHMGVKPLYYYFDGNSFFFASEVRALLAANIPAQLSKEALNSLLSYGSVQEPYTMIESVRSLYPGSYAILNENFEIKESRFWNPNFCTSKVKDIFEAEEETKYLLEDAIQLQLVSDVPLGAFLSGGIDSSAIVSLMRRVNPDADLRTFSIIFDDPKYDEREYARLVAKKNRTLHQELLMTGDMVKQSLTAMISSYDQPSVDGFNSWCVSKLVKDSGITVALSGVGGDELFVGYGDFSKPRQLYKFASFMEKFPNFVGNGIEYIAWNEKIRKLGESVTFKYDPYFLSRKVFSNNQYIKLIEKEFQTDCYGWLHKSYDGDLYDKYIDDISKISWLDQRTYMLSTLLRDTDQMSMAHSLEIRVPLLDHKVVEYVTSLPKEIKMSAQTPKHLLVKAAKDGIPEECIYRRKQGFTFPFDAYIQRELKSELESFYLGDCSPLFKKVGLKDLWLSYKKGKCAWSRILLLFIVDRWINKYRVVC